MAEVPPESISSQWKRKNPRKEIENIVEVDGVNYHLLALYYAYISEIGGN